jgi:cellulose synthase (UDP-forming)
VHAIGLLGAVVGGAYLVWRAGWTLNGDALWLSLPLFIAELHGYLTYLLFLFMTWTLPGRRPAQLAASPSVDCLIPTYNEPYEVLALTVAGATGMRGAHETYVLDDGRREWVRELCEKYGAHYITRPDTAGAKAGNINHALTVTGGELIAIVDADMVPSPSFVEDTLGYFGDGKVALVQGPQEFYNTDSFQHAGDGTDWHEQTTFYHVIQPGKNRWNAAFWCGSPSIVRRAALESVGGVATESVTEDLHTALRIHRGGWKTIYHDGTIARGVAPEDYNAFIIQRMRWAQGAMQVIRREWRMKGLTLAQKLNYVGSTGTYFDAYRKLVMLLIVPAMLLTDQLPVASPGPTFVVIWSVQFAVLFAANVTLGRGYYRYFRTEAFDFMKMFAFINASLVLVVEGTLKFRVTPKAQPGARRLHPLVLPYVAIIGLYATALGVGVLRLGDWGWSTGNREATVAAMGWGVAIAAILVALMTHTYRHVTRRRAFRVPVDLSATVVSGERTMSVHVRDLTLLGASLVTSERFEEGEAVTLTLDVPGVALDGVVRATWPLGEWWVVGLQLGEDAPPALARYLAGRIFTRDEEAAPPIQFPATAPLRAAS